MAKKKTRKRAKPKTWTFRVPKRDLPEIVEDLVEETLGRRQPWSRRERDRGGLEIGDRRRHHERRVEARVYGWKP